MTEENKHPIIIENLSKAYGDVQAVQNVSFRVNEGEIFGLIGPDGAGKTTIIRILVSLLTSDSGQVRFQGKDVSQNPAFVRANIGYMPQRFSLYPDLTVDENLNFFGDLFSIPKKIQFQRKEKLFEFSKLAPFQKRRAGQLSGGMKQKLALSCMLMHEPRVIVLDEPTFGVDPISREEFWQILKALAQNGTAVFVTTAYMDEARMCDRMGLIFEGRMLAVETPDKMLERFTEPLYQIISPAPHSVYEKVLGSAVFTSVNLFGDGVHITVPNKRSKADIQEEMERIGVPFSAIHKIKPGMEDLFLNLMKN